MNEEKDHSKEIAELKESLKRIEKKGNRTGKERINISRG